MIRIIGDSLSKAGEADRARELYHEVIEIEEKYEEQGKFEAHIDELIQFEEIVSEILDALSKKSDSAPHLRRVCSWAPEDEVTAYTSCYMLANDHVKNERLDNLEAIASMCL